MHPVSLRLAALVLGALGVTAGALAATTVGPMGGSGDTIVAPHNLNIESHGNFVTAILKNVTELSADLNASDMTATASVSVGGANVAVNATVRAYENHTVVVKIDRQAISAAIADALGSGGSVDDPLTLTVTVSGGGASVTRSGALDWFSHGPPTSP